MSDKESDSSAVDKEAEVKPPSSEIGTGIDNVTTTKDVESQSSGEKNEPEGTTQLEDDYLIKSGHDWDGEEIKREYVPIVRPKLLATPARRTELPPGAKFFKEVSRHSILEIEYEDPFESVKFFHLIGVEKKPLTLKDVPAEYRPYKGCIFVSNYCPHLIYGVCIYSM